MDDESFTQSLFDTPDDLAADGSLTVMRTEDFGAWYRRVRNAHEREVDALRDMRDGRAEEPDWDDQAALDHLTDAQLAEHGLVRMPTDADGVPIHVGDVMYDCNESPSEKFSAAIMELNKWGWTLIDSYGERNEPGQCRHYTPPTVEDVLREFTDEVWNRCCEGATASDSGIDELVAECAAKLRLAGENA